MVPAAASGTDREWRSVQIGRSDRFKHPTALFFLRTYLSFFRRGSY